MIIVYSEYTSNRLHYTLDVVFNYVLKTNYRLVSLHQFKKETRFPKLNYSTLNIENCIQITPHQLFFNELIENQTIKVDWIKKTPFLFKTSENKIAYDLLAATFFMVTRYEEYLPTHLDLHQRFKAENSVAYCHNFLRKPVVNMWSILLKKELQKQFPNYTFPKQNFKYLSTFDIDIAYSYKGKSAFKQFGGFVKSLYTLNKNDFKNRWNYYFNSKKDPFDTYEYIFKMHKKYYVKSTFFFLLANTSSFDKNLPTSSKPFLKLIKKITKNNDVGIHPSYQSNLKKSLLQQEIKRLTNIVQKEITKSRQHYLKLEFPTTYENLISNHIKEDYSMGFASQIGFRAGICTPYPFFNLTTNKTTNLLIYPFQIMDGTLNEYLKQTPSEAIKEIKNIIFEIKKVDGLFISLWHNSSLSEQNHWKNWKTVFEETLKTSAKQN